MPKISKRPIFSTKRFMEIDSVVYGESNNKSRQKGGTGSFNLLVISFVPTRNSL